MKYLKNKRANIPILILVLGIFLVCAIAIISFILSTLNQRDAFSGVGLIEKMNSQIENYGYSGSLEGADVRISDSGKKVFYQEKIDEAFFPWNEDVIIFRVEYPVN